ncbi:MAG: hypothetical protein NZV14_18250 [Bryobacteraceae bacterium]|nr:hypothetical protein [Bryobacteraceae bacterium]MDW8380108.1 hypothetical protein [Bryobacterales bacterium]
MAHTVPVAEADVARAAVALRQDRPSWYVWSFLASTICAVLGVSWDISWHMSIGRDTFWSPPHLLIYTSGLLAGLTAAWVILGATFQRDTSPRLSSVRIWGFQGPLGAFVAAWGALAMLTSAPFDNWWHNAYGLDTKILSPPHLVLAFGLFAIRLGALLVSVSEMNRASGLLRQQLTGVVLLLGGTVMGIAVGTFLELLSRNFMHSARFYLVLACTAPVVLASIRQVTGHPWAATIVAGVFSSFQLALLWILPLFPAEPKLGPVYWPVTHFIPAPFPVLVVVPAVAADLLRRRFPDASWRYALLAGPLFVFTLLAVQWPFADFLNSPHARNWIFGAHYFPYFLSPVTDLARGLYTQVETSNVQFIFRMFLAVACASLSTRLGLAWGSWLSRLRR